MYKDRILKLLRSSKSGFVSGEALAAKLGISRTMVWKHMKALEREGFGIEAVPHCGYRLLSSPDLLRREEIKSGLGTKIIGRDIRLFPEVVSTNTLAMQMASEGAPEGTAVIAETQTGGKGRLGRKWISPKGNLYLSVILRPELPPYKAPLITLMGAVAVATAIRTACALPAAIKWPNDIMLSGRKVSGLLTEMSADSDRIRHIVLGIGIDVNMDPAALPPDVRALATTLGHEAHVRIDRTELLQRLLRELEMRYRGLLEDDTSILREWESLNVTIGSRVSVSGSGQECEGLAEAVDAEGRLVVRLDSGIQQTVAAGDVTILKNRG